MRGIAIRKFRELPKATLCPFYETIFLTIGQLLYLFLKICGDRQQPSLRTYVASPNPDIPCF